MLETKDLVKVYKPKKGVPVTALNKVTLKFAETGMVFLLGKSGSGKSTLLNVLGGLDNYNDGEIIIKGVSSKSFKQKHFDSYRNTYVGFIFQEYNVLDEFTVGANIALAIELQNRKAEDSEVNKILKEVDLEGFAQRKPNELSGGQKQRVAIARALVKNPQIIMADEPTGALDSTTGRQILETLKKLSKEKLVIVVSHDREFAEQYADRIIELADGVVISDVELSGEEISQNNEISFNGNEIELPQGYHITEQDRVAINQYIDNLKSGKVSIKLGENRTNKRFKPTDLSKIFMQDGSTFKLIKSKLPFKNAFKIGGSSLKHKKLRLAITIILSCISFMLFGLSDTFGAYNHIEVCTNSLYDNQLKYIATAKSKRFGENNSYWHENGFYLSPAELLLIENNTGVKLSGAYVPANSNLEFFGNTDTSIKLENNDFQIHATRFSGFTEINQERIDEMGFEVLAGVLPDGTKNEIAISEYVFETFCLAKYTDNKLIKDANGKQFKNYVEISSYNDIIGKTIELDREKYVITAVIDTGFDLERYKPLIEEDKESSKTDKLIDFVLYNEFIYASTYSYAGLAMTGEGFIDIKRASTPPISPITEGYITFGSDSCYVDSQYLAKLSDMKGEKIHWLGSPRQTLSEKEIIITTDIFNYFEEIIIDENQIFEKEEDYQRFLLSKASTLIAQKNYFENDEFVEEEGYKIVGFIVANPEKTKIASTVICSDSLFDSFSQGKDCFYSFAIGATPKEKKDLKRFVTYCYDEQNNIRYPIQNSVTFELDSINQALKMVSKIFLYIGIAFALFASLMLSNFIATSISYKKQEIGILRAIGSRGNDVFRIFFAESFIIAMINFALSAVGVGVATAIINSALKTETGILITILTFDLRQIVLLFAVSVVVAFIASYLPVKKIASKRPIDAIRGR